jgi:hypothetical protein
MRSSGISVQRIALPLLILSLVICLGTFFWNETLVPIFTRQAQMIYKNEIKKRQQKSLYGTADIWMRGDGSFVNVDDSDATTIHWRVSSSAGPYSSFGVDQIPVAKWEAWLKAEKATEWRIMRMAVMTKTHPAPVTDSPEDLKLLALGAEEFTFFDLQKMIADMRNKGMDATRYEVDLQSKLSLPMISCLVVLIAIPFALKKQMSGSMALSFGIAGLIAFAIGSGGRLSAKARRCRRVSLGFQRRILDDRVVLFTAEE